MLNIKQIEISEDVKKKFPDLSLNYVEVGGIKVEEMREGLEEQKKILRAKENTNREMERIYKRKIG